MATQGEHEPGEGSIGALFGRLVDDAGQLLRAELDLYRKAAIRRFTRSRSALAAAFAALFIVQGAVAVLLLGFAMELARWIGPALAGLVVFVVAVGLAALLVRFAGRRLQEVTKRRQTAIVPPPALPDDPR